MNIAIIFAGGVGTRMRSKDLPKQFLRIHGEPIIVRTVRHFQLHPMVDAIVVVSGIDWLDYCLTLLEDHGMSKVVAVVPGGATGQESIFHGLLEAEKIAGGERSVVLVHDGVRPLINAQVISDNIEAVRKTGSAITCVLKRLFWLRERVAKLTLSLTAASSGWLAFRRAFGLMTFWPPTVRPMPWESTIILIPLL